MDLLPQSSDAMVELYIQGLAVPSIFSFLEFVPTLRRIMGAPSFGNSASTSSASA